MVRRCLLLALGLLAAPAGAEPSEVRLAAEPFPSTEVRLSRATLPVRVSLGFDRALLLNLAPAEQARLRPFPLVGKFRIRNSQIPGGEALIRGNLVSAEVAGTARQSLPTVWIDKDVVPPPHAGVVSITAIRAPRIRIANPSAPAGGAPLVLRRKAPGDTAVAWRLDGGTINLVMDFTSEATILNAAAADMIVAEGLARRTGRVALWSPVPALQLPVELLEPAAGAAALGLPLVRPAARITPARARELDAQTAQRIEGAVDDDPDAIVVEARREPGRRPRRTPWMLVGRDVLGRCSEVIFDRAAVSWQLTCRFEADQAGSRPAARSDSSHLIE